MCFYKGNCLPRIIFRNSVLDLFTMTDLCDQIRSRPLSSHLNIVHLFNNNNLALVGLLIRVKSCSLKVCLCEYFVAENFQDTHNNLNDIKVEIIGITIHIKHTVSLVQIYGQF